jgi:hypothetical protein
LFILLREKFAGVTVTPSDKEARMISRVAAFCGAMFVPAVVTAAMLTGTATASADTSAGGDTANTTSSAHRPGSHAESHAAVGAALALTRHSADTNADRIDRVHTSDPKRRNDRTSAASDDQGSITSTPSATPPGSTRTIPRSHDYAVLSSSGSNKSDAAMRPKRAGAEPVAPSQTVDTESTAPAADSATSRATTVDLSPSAAASVGTSATA